MHPFKPDSPFDRKLRRIEDETDLIQADIRKLEKKIRQKPPPLPAGKPPAPDRDSAKKPLPQSPTNQSHPASHNKLGKYLVTGSFKPMMEEQIPWPVRRSRRIFFTFLGVLITFILIWLLAGC